MKETIVHSRTVSGLLLDFKPAHVSNHPLSQNTKLKQSLVSFTFSAPSRFSSWLSVHVTQGCYMPSLLLHLNWFLGDLSTWSSNLQALLIYSQITDLFPVFLGSPLTYISQKIKCYFKLPAVPDRMTFHKQHELASRILLYSSVS